MEDQYPSLLTRMQSTFIDTIFIIILMVVISPVLDHITNAPDWLRVFLFVFIFLLYEPVCQVYGCTIGNYIMRIRVKKFTNMQTRINLPYALLRYVVKMCLGWISFVTIHSTPQRRALHDMAAGSVMICLP